MPPSFAHYLLGQEIADQLSTCIFKAVDETTQGVVAVKFPKSRCSQTPREFAILSKFRHPHIIPMIEALRTTNGPAIVLPFAHGGDLFDLIAEPLPASFVKAIAFRLLAALAFLHGQHVIHRDVKPENILFMAEDAAPHSVVLADFGLARQVESACTGEAFGSLTYAAPEILLGLPYGPEVDVWSFGVTVFACLTGHFPFVANAGEAIAAEIKSGLPALFAFPRSRILPDDAKDLIRGMLCPDQKRRITADEALAHRWFDEVKLAMAEDSE